MKKSLRPRLYAWWYFCISAGFLLLDVNRWLAGERPWLIGLRLAIAAGFAALGFITLQGK